MDVNFQQAEYLRSVFDPKDLPLSAGEVAFAGRSNAGKSSVINTLCRHKHLAHVSKEPGCTRALNFFGLGRNRFLVDLPGYGFARAPADVRAQWDQLLGGYLRTRTALLGMVVIMDIRHPLTPLDEQMLEWFIPSGRPVHLVLTKADKLGRQAGAAALAGVQTAIAGQPAMSVQPFSSLKRTGLDELERTLRTWFAAPAVQEREAPGAP